MRGIRGYFMYIKDHRATDHHSREQVKSAMNLWKANKPSILLSQEDVEYIAAIFSDKEKMAQNE